MDTPVVTVITTIMDGTVVRWYRNLEAADLSRPMISASRNGVAVHRTYLTDVPDELITAAREAYEKLRRERSADMTALATHVQRGMRGPHVPVGQGGDDG